MEEFLQKSKDPIEQPPNSGIYRSSYLGNKFTNELQIPSIQREIDDEWVEELYESQIQDYNKKGYIDLGMFELCILDDNIYLLNGQHRYMVLRKLLNTINNIYIDVKIQEVKTEHEMNILFQKVNKSRPSIILKNSNIQVIINQFRKLFKKYFVNYLVASNKPHRPHINLDNLITEIIELEIIKKLQIKRGQQLFDLVIELNNYYKNLEINKMLKWNIKDFDKIYSKCKEKSVTRRLYLGIYTNNEWLSRILHCKLNNICYTTIPHISQFSKREKIGKRKRRDVWNKVNSDTINGICYVCNNKLDFEEFECGHVVSVFYGGTTNIDNLQPVCKICNQDMGIEHLEEYRKRIKI